MLGWEIRRFLTVVISIQAAMAVLLVLAALGIDIPGVRQVVAFIYLTFVPGLLILRIMRFRNLGGIETLLYSAGLSIALVMFAGFFMNLLYPVVGITRPISTPPLAITMTIIVMAMCVFTYLRERRESLPQTGPNPVPWSEILSPPVLFLLLLPILSALGAYYLANFLQNNTLLLVLIALTALVAIMVAFDVFIPRRLYPLAILMVAISLVWHWSLISQYISGFDIHHEYYFQNLVLTSGSWDYTLRSNVNSMLSIVMLGPAYSLLLDMDIVWVLKVIYPLLFSMLPVSLFLIFRKQTEDRIAFFAVFFFMSFSFFFSDSFQLARLEIAELFFGLFLLSLLDSTTTSKRTLLLVIWGLSIVVSHYGLSYFVLFYLVLARILLALMENRTLSNLWENLTGKFHRRGSNTGRDVPAFNLAGAARAPGPLTITYVALFITFCFAWYMYIGTGSSFHSIINIGVHTYQSVSEFLLPETREPAVLMAIGLSSPEVTSAPRNIYLVIQYITQFFIVIGVIGLLFNLQKTRFQPLYTAMVLASSLVLLLCILLPRFSGFFNISRIYHIVLLLLAPFCVLGGMAVFRWLFKALSSRLSHVSTTPVFLKLTVILVLVPYFLFNTAFIYAVTGDTVTSIALNPEMDFPRYNEQEVHGKEWLQSNMPENSVVEVDWYGVTWLVADPRWRGTRVFFGEDTEIPDGAYVFLRSLNVKKELVISSRIGPRRYVDLPGSTFGEALAHRSRVYSNGGAGIYH